MNLELSEERPDPPADAAEEGAWLACIDCDWTGPPFEEVRYRCPECASLLEVRYADHPTLGNFADSTERGVWRYADALPVDSGVSIEEGDTPLYEVPTIEAEVGVADLRVKHEGMNPTGSFKDRGMTLGVRVAEKLGVDRRGSCRGP